MKHKQEWSRVQRVHEYCDICINRTKCNDWCFGELFQQDTTETVKNSLISRLIAWIRGGNDDTNKAN